MSCSPFSAGWSGYARCQSAIGATGATTDPAPRCCPLKNGADAGSHSNVWRIPRCVTLLGNGTSSLHRLRCAAQSLTGCSGSKGISRACRMTSFTSCLRWESAVFFLAVERVPLGIPLFALRRGIAPVERCDLPRSGKKPCCRSHSAAPGLSHRSSRITSAMTPPPSPASKSLHVPVWRLSLKDPRRPQRHSLLERLDGSPRRRTQTSGARTVQSASEIVEDGILISRIAACLVSCLRPAFAPLFESLRRRG